MYKAKLWMLDQNNKFDSSSWIWVYELGTLCLHPWPNKTMLQIEHKTLTMKFKLIKLIEYKTSFSV